MEVTRITVEQHPVKPRTVVLRIKSPSSTSGIRLDVNQTEGLILLARLMEELLPGRDDLLTVIENVIDEQLGLSYPQV